MGKRLTAMTTKKPSAKAIAANGTSLACPLCKSQLNMRYDGFSIYEAVNGPYVRGRISLECSKHECPYRHTTHYHSSDLMVIRRMEKAMGSLVHSLPDFGPWNRLEFSTKPKMGRRHRMAIADAATKRQAAKKVAPRKGRTNATTESVLA